MDYVFENKDGSVINIQFDDNGKKYVKNYKSADDFLKTLDSRLENYKDFYNEVTGFKEFEFIGYADGHEYGSESK
jgi:hypothetical protein